jgi:hypothetical protein
MIKDLIKESYGENNLLKINDFCILICILKFNI